MSAKRKSQLSWGKKILLFFLGLISAAVILSIPAGVFWYLNDFSLNFNIPQSEEITIARGSTYEAPQVVCLLQGKYVLKEGKDVPLIETGTVDAETIGTYTEVYDANWMWMYAQATRTIHVTDQTPPVITMNGEQEITIEWDSAWEDPGCTALDETDGDLTDQIRTEGEVDSGSCGSYTLTYLVEDSAGNETTAERKVTVVDVTPPVLTLNGKEKMSLTEGGSFEDPGCAVSDNVDTELSVTVDGSVDTSTPGTYTLTYSATDAAGNSASVTRKVTVYKKVVRTVKNPGDKVVYLTFDDGPYKYTQELLDVLAKYDAKATFFVTNQFPGYQYMIAREAAAGHTVAIHTYSHDYAQIYASTDAYFEDLDKMNAIIKKQTGSYSSILRFPGGSSNAVSKKYCTGIMTELTQAVEAEGYVYCDWNVDSNDAGGATTADEVAENVIAGIQKHNVSYVLQHDIKDFSVEAVEQILQWGQENGYTFLALSSSSPMTHHSLNN